MYSSRLKIALAAIILALLAVPIIWLLGCKSPPASWPPARPLLRLAEGAAADAAKIKAFDDQGETRPLTELLAERNEQPGRVAIGKVLESALHAPAPTTISKYVTLPPDARLAFDYALLPEAWNSPRQAAVRFSVTVRAAAGADLATWQDEISTAQVNTRRWQSAVIDLSAYAGKQAQIAFKTERVGWRAPRAVTDLAVFGNPTLFSAAPEPTKMNIILILIDTLRADHLGCYGHPAPTSPAIDALAAQGLRFSYAFSQAPYTPPSVGSLLTSRYPGDVLHPTRSQAIATDAATFPQLLQDDYICAAVSASPIADWRANFDLGFDLFNTYPSRGYMWGTEARVVMDDVTPLLEKCASRPFFLFLHFMDPHDPYNPPAEFTAPFLPDHYSPALPDVAAGRSAQIEKDLDSGVLDGLSQPDIDYLLRLYDASTLYADSYIAKLLEELDRLGLRQNTAIIITADHGEEFMEHGWLRHGHTVYVEQLHVPLIVVPPPGTIEPRAIEQPASLVDVGPTVLDFAGLGESFGEGRSLLRLADGSVPPAPVFSELGSWFFPGSRRQHKARKSLLSGPWHFIIAEDGTAELYNLLADPAEQRNLATSRPDLVASLQAQLPQLAYEQHPRKSANRPALDPATKRALEALGYLK